MKTKLLLTIFGIFSACFFVNAQPGFTCVEAIGIGPLPYTITDNSANYGDTVDNSLSDGNDVFYSFVPIASGSYSASVFSADNYTSLRVYATCVNIPNSPISAAASLNHNTSYLPSLNLTAGVTYYFHVTSTSVQTINYTFSLAKHNCSYPTAITVGTIGTTTADLSWNNPAGASDFEVVVQPRWTGLPTGSGIPVSGTAYSVSGLDPDTQYEVWVRSACGDGTFSAWSMRQFFKTEFFNTQCPSENQCNYIFELRDAFGDGWNGNSMTVTQNGVAVATAMTMSGAGSEESVSVPLCDGIPFELYWNAGGSFPSEIWVKVINPNGEVIYEKPPTAGAQDSLLYTGTPECDWVDFIPFIDTNSNGIMDSGEAIFMYGSFVYQLNDSGPFNTVMSSSGIYSLYDNNPLNSYDFSYEVDSSLSSYYTIAPITHQNITIAAHSGVQAYYFPVTQLQPFSNVSVTLFSQSFPPRPNFAYSNIVEYKNHETTPVSGTITFNHDPLVTLSSILPGATPIINGFTYNYTLAGNETKWLYLTMSVPDVPTVNLGDLLTNTVSIAATSDVFLSDNASSLTQEVVNSYDPNNKLESHGGQIQANTFTADDYLYYTINFQNLGTANAIDVRIEDVLDDNLDEETIRMVSASHEYVMFRNGNNVTWKFDHIQLPPSAQSEPLSHGYVVFKIKPKPGFAIGDIIPNTAEIFFDTNPAIVTNTFLTEFVSELGVTDLHPKDATVFPNPTTGPLNVALASSGTISKIDLYDMLGQHVVGFGDISAAAALINVSMLARGMYLMTIETSDGQRMVKKLVKK